MTASSFPVRRLAEVANKIQDGTHFSPRLGGGGFKYITSKNIGFGKLRLDSVDTISFEEHEKIYRRADTRFGDVLLTKDGANTGNAALNTFNEEISLLSSVAFIRANPKLSVEPFILQYFLSGDGQRQITDAMSGNAITRLTLTKIKDLLVPVPGVDEQQRIGAALGDVDSLMSSLERLIAKKRAIKQGMMQELLTGKRRLPGFAEPWRVIRLGDHVTYVKNVALSRAQLDSSSPLRYLHYGDIHTRSASTLDASVEHMPRAPRLLARNAGLLQVGDLVFADASEDPDGVGKSVEITGVPDEGVIPGLHTIAARFDKRVFADGFKAYLQFMADFRAQLLALAAGTKVLATTRAYISRIELNLPGVAEQTAISEAVRDAEIEVEALARRLEATRAIKQGMMQELLTGRTRLQTREEAA
ncbi:restriction endonuclease subunit S [Leucobacter triazinivorans]|uniref:Restriction endonuclease subunit S n=1 Tax=Leucobacter triazinivorans TaxID=1784719 RepID=A0A4P6KHA4_9MICO|nr:restriction endonuclease subunit S [Leucobacter triazinivorans]QBE49836.1 restriction endonuclease subunit S [Leucobacter triazinivorans]